MCEEKTDTKDVCLKINIKHWQEPIKFDGLLTLAKSPL